MKVYRILHKPTGLYYTPSKGSGNLSTNGKAYVNIVPRIKDWIGTYVNVRISGKGTSKKAKILIDYFNIQHSHKSHGKKYFYVNENFKVSLDDWEIIEVA